MTRTTARRSQGLSRINYGFVRGGVEALVDAHVTMEGHDQVGDADGLHDGQDYGTLHLVTRTILAMGLSRADMEVGNVAGTRPEG